MKALATALRLALSAVVLAGIVLLLFPQEASACTVGIGYKPSVDVRALKSPGTCSTGTSLAGAGVVAVLAAAAVAASGWFVHRRGERYAARLPHHGSSGPDPALTDYLDAAGMTPPVPREAGENSAQDHR